MRLSASQISTWLDCRRKWVFTYVDRLPVEPGKASLLGTDTHAQWETYLAGGQLDYTRESGYIAAATLENLPSPGPDLEIEHEFLLKSRRHEYAGVIDCRKGSLVIDHKTTSDLKWAKTPEDLLWDVQANLYAATTFVHLPWTSSVRVLWSYVTTRKPYKALPVEAVIHREACEDFFLTIEEISDRIQDDKETPALDLPPSPETCEKYGGCPFRYKCNLGPLERMKSIMTVGTENLIQALRNKRAVNPPPVDPPGTVGTVYAANGIVPPPAAPVEEPPPPPVAAEKKDTIPAPPPDAPATETPKEKAKKPPIDTLYLGCFPLNPKRKVEYFETFLAKAKDLVNAQAGVDDYRFLQYGQGPGALASAFRSVIQDAQIHGLVVLNIHTAECQACWDVLLNSAAQAIRGV